MGEPHVALTLWASPPTQIKGDKVFKALSTGHGPKEAVNKREL